MNSLPPQVTHTHNTRHLLIGPVLALALFFLMSLSGVNATASATAAITMLTAWWWATEALPIAATSLLPFALFPLFGVLNHKEAASGLGSHIILLMLGGFIMAKALERTGAHQRFATVMLRAVGTNSAKRLIAAFMLTAALLSMWISNTATCLMLMPIALACLKQVDNPKLNGFPIVACLLPITLFVLSRNVSGDCAVRLPAKEPWTADQKRVISVFVFIVILWIFRSQPFGGWSGMMGLSGVGDATIAMLGAGLMFIVRSEKGDGLLDWQTASAIPWGILLMFAAGITIAKAFFASGLADIIGANLSAGISSLPLYLVMLLVCLSITFFTELNSNLATTTLVLPILAATAGNIEIAPELLMIPATISASCAFMLPVATAPNAIAYATEYISVRDMLREGLVLNITLAFVISGLCYALL